MLVRVALTVIAAIAGLASACVSREVHSYPSRLREHATELQGRGRATIESVDEGAFEVRASTRVSISQRDDGATLTREVTIGELVAGCDPAAGATPGCLADHVVERDTVVGEKRERRLGAAVTSIITTATGVGLVGLCVVQCDGKDVAIGSGLIVGGLIIFVLGFALH